MLHGAWRHASLTDGRRPTADLKAWRAVNFTIKQMSTDENGTTESAPASVAGAAEALADQLAPANLSDADDHDQDVDDAQKEDPELWKPHPPTEECPVCLVPLPLHNYLASYWSCCGMTVCCACGAENDRALCITNKKRKEKKLPPIEKCCAFCRAPSHCTESEMIKSYEDRAVKGDLQAMFHLAGMHRDGRHGLSRDEAKALELMQRAADLGSPEALYILGQYFLHGDLGLTVDEDKSWRCMEDATKRGDVCARQHLGSIEERHQHHDLAIKHFKLAAAAGEEISMKRLWNYFSSKKLTKAELEATLRAHKAVCDEMNSDDRERYIAWDEVKEGNDGILKNLYTAYYYGAMTAKGLNVALKVYQSGDIDRTMTILFKCEKALGINTSP